MPQLVLKINLYKDYKNLFILRRCFLNISYIGTLNCYYSCNQLCFLHKTKIFLTMLTYDHNMFS